MLIQHIEQAPFVTLRSLLRCFIDSNTGITAADLIVKKRFDFSKSLSCIRLACYQDTGEVYACEGSCMTQVSVQSPKCRSKYRELVLYSEPRTTVSPLSKIRESVVLAATGSRQWDEPVSTSDRWPPPTSHPRLLEVDLCTRRVEVL